MTELKNEEGTEFLLRTDLPNRTAHIIVAVSVLYLGVLFSDLVLLPGISPKPGCWAHSFHLKYI